MKPLRQALQNGPSPMAIRHSWQKLFKIVTERERSIVIGIFSLFINVWPEAICCCLQTCYVDVMFLLMDCVCILTFIVDTLLVV